MRIRFAGYYRQDELSNKDSTGFMVPIELSMLSSSHVSFLVCVIDSISDNAYLVEPGLVWTQNGYIYGKPYCTTNKNNWIFYLATFPPPPGRKVQVAVARNGMTGTKHKSWLLSKVLLLLSHCRYLLATATPSSGG